MGRILEARLLVAYGLLFGIALAGGIGGMIYARRRGARRRRLRGIKSYNSVARH